MIIQPHGLIHVYTHYKEYHIFSCLHFCCFHIFISCDFFFASYTCTVDRRIFVVKNISSVPLTSKILHVKYFPRWKIRSKESTSACTCVKKWGIWNQSVLYLILEETWSVYAGVGILYTLLIRVSHLINILSCLNFGSNESILTRKFNRWKFLQPKISRATVQCSYTKLCSYYVRT